jgi:hypothetical protein
MTSKPFHRRALVIDLPRSTSRAPVPRPIDERTRLRESRSHAVLAVSPPPLLDMMALGLRAFRVEQRRVRSVAGFFDSLAAQPDVVVLSDPFAGVPAVNLLAVIRTAGYRAPVVVLGHAGRELRARRLELGPITLIADPASSDAARGEPWLRRCLDCFMPPARRRDR